MLSVASVDSTVAYLIKHNFRIRFLMFSASHSYKASISSLYSFKDSFLITVPFPARGSGLSSDVMRIISLKSLLNAGATLLALSITGL